MAGGTVLFRAASQAYRQAIISEWQHQAAAWSSAGRRGGRLAKGSPPPLAACRLPPAACAASGQALSTGPPCRVLAQLLYNQH